MSLKNINTILVNEWDEPVKGAHASITNIAGIRISDTDGRITFNNIPEKETLEISYVDVKTTIPVTSITTTTPINTIIAGEEVVIENDKKTAYLGTKIVIGGFIAAMLYAAISTKEEPAKITF